MKRIFFLLLTAAFFAAAAAEGIPPKGYLKAGEIRILLENFGGRRRKPEIFKVFGHPSSKGPDTYSWRLHENDALMTFETAALLDFLSNLTVTQVYDTRKERDVFFPHISIDSPVLFRF